MSVPIGTSANRFTGIRELGQVTNTYAGYLQSAGAAYNITLPFFPDKFEWYRYTSYGTNDINLQGVWFRGFPAGDSLIIRRGTTDLTSVLETTNGITNASTAGGFTNQHLTITGITGPATPPVVTTSTAHGLVDGDRVMITKVIGTMASEINNRSYVVDVLTSTTFGLYDTYGLPIAIAGAYTSSGQVTKEGPELGIEDDPPTYILTLGSAIMGADNDALYFVATKFNNYVNLGDVA
jgi:hypothetical protein